MRKPWILVSTLIIALSVSACGNKVPATEPKQETEEPAKPDVEAANPEQQPNDGDKGNEGAFKIPDFVSQDFSGNEVTNEFFEDNKLTVINVWTST